MNECKKCGFNNEYGYCECNSQDKWYACPIESKKPENIKTLREYAEYYKDRDEYYGDLRYRM